MTLEQSNMNKNLASKTPCSAPPITTNIIWHQLQHTAIFEKLRQLQSLINLALEWTLFVKIYKIQF